MIVRRLNQNLKFRHREFYDLTKFILILMKRRILKHIYLTQERPISRGRWLLFRKFIFDWNFRIYCLNFRKLGCRYILLVRFSSPFLSTSPSRRHMAASFNSLYLNRTFLPTHRSSSDYRHFESFSLTPSFVHCATALHLVSPDTDLG